jgi:hypothetical protein
VEAVEGFCCVSHSSLFVLAAAAKEHWILEHAEGSRSDAQNSFFFIFLSLAGHISSATNLTIWLAFFLNAPAST